MYTPVLMPGVLLESAGGRADPTLADEFAIDTADQTTAGPPPVRNDLNARSLDGCQSGAGGRCVRWGRAWARPASGPGFAYRRTVIELVALRPPVVAVTISL